MTDPNTQRVALVTGGAIRVGRAITLALAGAFGDCSRTRWAWMPPIARIVGMAGRSTATCSSVTMPRPRQDGSGDSSSKRLMPDAISMHTTEEPPVNIHSLSWPMI